jgi:tRNA (guanine37-N1)-methyltransferase
VEVPEILLSGNHGMIDLWRFEEAIKLTKERRPDLFEAFIKSERTLTKQEKKIIEKYR